MCAAFYDCLESERVEIDASVFKFDSENMAELRRD